MASHAAQLHSSRFQSVILVSKPQMYTGSNATSLLLQLCLLRERAGLRPRVPTTLLQETVRPQPWTTDLLCPELRVLRLIPTVVETPVSSPLDPSQQWPQVTTLSS